MTGVEASCVCVCVCVYRNDRGGKPDSWCTCADRIWHGTAARQGQEAANAMWHARRFYWTQRSPLQSDCLEWPFCYVALRWRRRAPVDAKANTHFLWFSLSFLFFSFVSQRDALQLNSWIPFSLGIRLSHIIFFCSLERHSVILTPHWSHGVFWVISVTEKCYASVKMDRLHAQVTFITQVPW